MRSLILASIIAFILQDHGTSQGSRQKSSLTTNEQVILFKKYAANLINAAIPPLANNNDIMELGCECITTVDDEESLTSLNLILTTMSIAKYYKKDLDFMRRSPDILLIIANISKGMTENVRKIADMLEYPSKHFELIPIDKVFKEHLLNYKLNPLYIALIIGKRFSESIESSAKCYRLMLSMYYNNNERFFAELLRGFKAASKLMEYELNSENEVDRQTEDARLNAVIEIVSKCQLDNPDPNFKKKEFEEFVESLNNKNQMEKTQGLLFFLLATACFGGAIMWMKSG